jgi:uridine kinase
MRGGDIIERALAKLYPDVHVGKLLIKQSADKAEGPRLFYCKLEQSMHTGKVMLFDTIVSTANNAQMAIRVLLDHGVAESSIIFVCFLGSRQGVKNLAQLFPEITIVASMLDDGLDENFYTTPGAGSIGHRYFGTKASEPVSPSSHA